jgi:tRNA dimethylallyltransferase
VEEKKPLIILTGPTAVGKTEISIKLAKAVNGAIISADSMQVYRHMDIGTAKIKPVEMQGIRHYLIDVLEPDEEFNITVFQKMAKAALDEIYSENKIPIIAGGTGFYIQSVLYDIAFTQNDDSDKTYRDELYRIADEKGAEYLHCLLKEADADAAAAIHANNVKRVVRALEYYHQTGTQISKHNEEESKKESPYNYVYFVLNDERKELYDRIDRRVDKMFDDGLVNEVSSLKDAGYTKELVSMQGIGYKELLSYLDGEYDLEMTKYIIKRDTRHFAKRQLTWFKRERDVTWVNYPDYKNDKEKMLEAMLEICKAKNIL